MKKGSFTLVELLVVVAIIGILASLLLPSLGRARKAALTKVCLSNQKQIGYAAHLYSLDCDGHIIGDNFSKGFFFATHYSILLGGPSLGQVTDDDTATAGFKEVGAYQCPSVPKDELYLDYTINSLDFRNFIDSGNRVAVDTHRLDALPFSPSEAGYVYEVNVQGMIDDGIRYSYWDVKTTTQSTYNHVGAPNNNPRMMKNNDNRHLKKTTVTFFDAHSETRHLKTMSYSPIVNPLE
ncbi:MAG: type II secretion system GspH family protein [Lentisphaeraceae bacterium]|nr:type II secretion system GspH family protein [Lentisphaeraceae bacterium]